MNWIIILIPVLFFLNYLSASDVYDFDELFGEGQLDFLIDPDFKVWEDTAEAAGTDSGSATSAALDPVVPEEPASIEYAGPELKYIGKNLLSFHPGELSERLNALGPREIKKSLKISCNWNLLHEAVYTDNIEIARVLLNDPYRFDPNKFDPHFGNCVYLVSSVRMVNLLKDHGADFSINIPCHLYLCPIDSAIVRRNASIYAHPDLSSFNARVNNFIVKLRSAQTSGSVKKFFSTKKDMYQHALSVVKGFTATRTPNAKIKVSYCDEAGIDAGGLTVDFITFIKDELIKGGKTFENDSDTGFLNFKADAPLAETRLAGFIVGLSIFHQVPLNIVFSPIIYHLICTNNPHRINFVSVLAEGHPTIYNSFVNLKGCPDSALGDLEQSQLRGDEHRPWKRRKSHIGDKEGLTEYIKTSAKLIAFDERFPVYDQFLTGLGHAINYHNISLDLNPDDLKTMLKGQVDYTAREMTEHALLIEDETYGQLYTWFFEIVDEISPDQRAKLLKFFTSLECLPVGGFKDLNEQIKLDVIATAEAPDKQLPQAATCFNKLNLQLYSSKSVMKNKLIMAIEECSGFHNA